ncbi:helix-turn-helix transcriptional regulator [Paraburkholderia gardini]|uniref:AlpA family phage regulatory protein n=1 Tax=Paraburkholderia gardini TaxID=2823469 RepID=A0ABM8U646_9BURK|nr:hypothetical protein R54767_03405 [Paraburkholderia gardini]
MTTRSRNVPAGARCLSPKQTYTKFSRQKSWLWDRVKNDPTFPRPLYLGPRSPVFLEHELDAWLEHHFD